MQANLEEYENDVGDQRLSQFQLSIQKFSNFALYVINARRGQFQQLLETRVILILNFTRPHAITYTNCYSTSARTLDVISYPTRARGIILKYSWRFSRYSAPITWLWNCFPPNAMSGQHCENYDVKQETVHCYPRNVDRCCTWSERVVEGGLMLSPDLSAFFKICFCFVLLDNKSLNHWSLGKQWILFPSNLNVSFEFVYGNIDIQCSPRDQSLSVIHNAFGEWYPVVWNRRKLEEAWLIKQRKEFKYFIQHFESFCMPFFITVLHFMWNK